MKHTKRIYVVFPGLGKTYMCLHRAGFADCDYGYYRAASKTSTKDPKLLQFSQRLLNIYAKEGFIVLTNEPTLIPYLLQLDAKVTMVLPKLGVDLGKRILQREKEHPINSQWARQFNDEWINWVADWMQIATRYSVEVKYVDYLNESYSLLFDKRRYG